MAELSPRDFSFVELHWPSEAARMANRITPQSSSASPFHRRSRRILELEPVRRAPRAIDEVLSLQHDAFEAQLAGMLRYFICCVFRTAAHRYQEISSDHTKSVQDAIEERPEQPQGAAAKAARPRRGKRTEETTRTGNRYSDVKPDQSSEKRGTRDFYRRLDYPRRHYC